MRRPAKFRLLFLLLTVSTYWLASFIMPETLPALLSWTDWSSEWFILGNSTWLTLVSISVIFFIILPICYWHLVVKIGEQPAWKIIIIFSLSSLVARYQYPDQIAQYFEFILYFRYPIIAVLLIIELFLMYTVVKSLWQARSLTGDPRVHAINKYDHQLVNSDISDKVKTKLERERDLSITFAHEPASWYYAIKRFSRKHVNAIANIKLLSANRWHFLLVSLFLLAIAAISYLALVDFSETLALVIATLVIYSAIMFVANYRASRYYSFYIIENKVVINDAWWGMLVFDLHKITSIQQGECKGETDQLQIGRGKPNLRIEFSEPQSFFTMMAAICDKVTSVNLVVDEPEHALNEINQARLN